MRHHHLLRLVLALAIAACVATDAGALDKVRVGKPSVRGFIFTFVELGMATGIYAKNGIAVESLAFGADGITIAPLGATEVGMAALIAGNIDGLTGNSDQMILLEVQGKARIITLFSEFVPDFPAFVIFASRALIDGKPDVVRRFMKGTLDTLAFMRAHKAETLKLAKPIMELPDAVADKVYDDEMPTFTDGRFTPTGMAILRRSMLEFRLLAEVPPDNVLFTERFLPAN